MLSLDPLRLVRRQLEIDRERTSRFPHLLAHKVERMAASPLALLRGSAPLFYEVVARHPLLAEGPRGDGWLVGDAHLENFGAYRCGVLSTAESKDTRARETVVFDLNDFDDAFVGPWRLDVLRLLTRLILGGRETGADGLLTLKLCDTLVTSYVATAFGGRRPSLRPPAAVTDLLEQVRKRSRKDLLDARTEIVRGARRFVRGPRYESLPRKLRTKAEKAFQKYIRKLPEAEQPSENALEVLDAAFRVAGTGSLGSLRIALLVRGKGDVDGAWVFDIKEEGQPSSAVLKRPPKLEPADRVCTAIRACLAQPPRMIGATKVRGRSAFARRLAPQEDKLDLGRLATADLEPLAAHLGALLGRAHRRGATFVPKKAWTESDRRGLFARAMAMAGLHEAMYLAYCDLVRR